MRESRKEITMIGYLSFYPMTTNDDLCCSTNSIHTNNNRIDSMKSQSNVCTKQTIHPPNHPTLSNSYFQTLEYEERSPHSKKFHIRYHKFVNENTFRPKLIWGKKGYLREEKYLNIGSH